MIVTVPAQTISITIPGQKVTIPSQTITPAPVIVPSYVVTAPDQVINYTVPSYNITIPDPTPPSVVQPPTPTPIAGAPTNLVVTLGTNNVPVLTWTPISGAFGQNVYRNGAWADSMGGSKNTWTEKIVISGTVSYSVSIYDASGTSGPKSNPVTVTIPVPTPPIVPSPAAYTGVMFPTSFFAKKLSSTTPIRANSATLVTELARNYKGPDDPWINSDNVAVPLYIVTTNITKVPVRLVLKGTSTPDTGRPILSARLAQGFRIPISAIVAGGTDHQFAVLDTLSDEYFELWLGKKTVIGWDCVNAAVVQQASKCDGTVPQVNGEWWGASATHIPVGGGIILNSDLNGGSINHVLSVAIPFPSSKFVWPASASDGSDSSLAALPEGMRFRLPSTYVPDPSAPPLVKMITTALRDYGLVIVDYAGSFCFATENANQYGVSNILGPYMGGKQLWDIMPMIPISSMQALA